MKTITFLKSKNKKLIKAFIFTMFTVSLFGQVQQNGSLYIGDSGVVSVFTTPYNFGTSPATTVTTRTALNYGKLYFPAGSTTANATNNHHVNGYVSSFGNPIFTYPVGNGTVLAPAKIQGASLTANFDCAYYATNPNTSYSSVDSGTLKAISTVEYWDLFSTASANLTLTWRSASDLANLTTDIVLEDVVIAGWNGTQWEQIPSVVDANYLGSGALSTLTEGSVTSTIAIPYSMYSKFTLAAKGSCQPLIASSGTTKTWNGSWSPSVPTLADPVIINTAYAAGSFSCNALVLNADVTLAANQYIEVVNGVTGTSKIIMATSASFVQRATGVAAPNVEMTKTREGLRRYDYVYFGTPIVSDFFSDFATAKASTVATTNAFDLFYKYNTGNGGGWQATAATELGRGLIARIKQAAPFTDATTTDDVSVVFDGVANNGDVNLPTITNNIAQPFGGSSHILLGNPYPSAIDGDKFLVENTDLDGVLYIWTSATSYPGSGIYSQADYLAYTRAGSVSPAPLVTNTFDGKIPSGQAFKVRITPDASNPTTVSTTADVVFNNCMRVTGDNSSFYKNTQQNTTVAKDRFKINMTGANGLFSQILVAYLPEATLGYDRMYDAGSNSVSTAQFYSIFEGDGRRLAINARPIFENTDSVPVGIRKNNTNTETFVFTITEQEGVFVDPSVKVYLHDKIANTYHDFSTGSYTYTTNEAIVNSRFEIVYQSSVLNNAQFDLPEATVVLNNNTLSVKSADNIKNIQVYDLTGRLVQQYNAIDATTFVGKFNHAESIYIAKVNFVNGAVVNRKLIHTKK